MSQQTTRPTKKLGELTPGDFVFHRRQNDSEPGTVCEVKAVLPYRDGDGRQMVSGLIVPVAGGAPLHVRQFANILYVMADEAAVGEAGEVARRIAVANALRQLADDIAAQALPVSTNWIDFRMVLDSRTDVGRWAEYLGVETKVGATNRIPSADLDRPVVDRLTLDIHVQGPVEPVATHAPAGE